MVQIIDFPSTNIDEKENNNRQQNRINLCVNESFHQIFFTRQINDGN